MDDLYFIDLRTNNIKFISQKSKAPQDKKKYHEMLFYSPKIHCCCSCDDEDDGGAPNGMNNEELWDCGVENLLLATSQGEIMFFENGLEKKCKNLIHASSSSILGMEIDPFGKTLACGSADSVVSFWDLKSLICEKSFMVSKFESSFFFFF